MVCVCVRTHVHELCVRVCVGVCDLVLVAVCVWLWCGVRWVWQSGRVPSSPITRIQTKSNAGSENEILQLMWQINLIGPVSRFGISIYLITVIPFFTAAFNHIRHIPRNFAKL